MSYEQMWLTCDETARRLEVTRQAVSKRIKEGKLTTWRHGRNVYVLEADVHAWIMERLN